MPTDACTVRRSAGYTVVTLPAEIDAGNADRVREELLRTLDHGPAVLIVDMTGTSFCAAAGVHALMRARHRAAAVGTGLRVAVSVPIVRRVLEITGTSQLLEILPSLGAAVDGRPPRQPRTVAAPGRDGQPSTDGQLRPGGAGTGAGSPTLTGRMGRAEETPR